MHQKLTDIERDRDTAANIPFKTDLLGNKEQPAEIESEIDRDKALMVSPVVIGNSRPERTAHLAWENSTQKSWRKLKRKR